MIGFSLQYTTTDRLNLRIRQKISDTKQGKAREEAYDNGTVTTKQGPITQYLKEF